MTLSRKPHKEGAHSTIAPGKRIRWRPDPEDVGRLRQRKTDVEIRSGGRCEGCGGRLPMCQDEWDLAHRVSRRVKRWRYDLRNLLALHRHCHERAGSGNQEARDAGLWLRTTDDPTTEPVKLYVFGTRGTRRVRLTETGYEDVA